MKNSWEERFIVAGRSVTGDTEWFKIEDIYEGQSWEDRLKFWRENPFTSEEVEIRILKIRTSTELTLMAGGAQKYQDEPMKPVRRGEWTA